jgi:hypothetical protein
VIRTIDCFFEGMAERMVASSQRAGASAEAIIEDCWKIMKRGIMRLYDPDADAEGEPSQWGFG